MSWNDYTPYVPVAKRRQQAEKKVKALKKKGHGINPIVIEGRMITKTFWGKAWCKHLESFSDYKNRLPRGRTYVRNGSVIDLKLSEGTITALVSGSSIYKVEITITPISTSKWASIVQECAGKIDSLIELLQGKFSKGVMEIISHEERGLFPHPQEIKLNCSCYDYADMCKHVAAVLYGIGAHLDERPEDLFLLRKANHIELIDQAGSKDFIKEQPDQDIKTFTGDIASVFGIDIEGTEPSISHENNQTRKHTQKRRKRKQQF